MYIPSSKTTLPKKKALQVTSYIRSVLSPSQLSNYTTSAGGRPALRAEYPGKYTDKGFPARSNDPPRLRLPLVNDVLLGGTSVIVARVDCWKVFGEFLFRCMIRNKSSKVITPITPTVAPRPIPIYAPVESSRPLDDWLSGTAVASLSGGEVGGGGDGEGARVVLESARLIYDLDPSVVVAAVHAVDWWVGLDVKVDAME